MSSPDDLADVLTCTLCRRRLRSPATFRCGHAICARHLSPTTLRCPVPACRADSLSPPPAPALVAPPHVAIRYENGEPAPVVPAPILPTTRDVTLNKVLNLVARTQQCLAESASASNNDNDDDDDRPRRRRRLDSEPDLLSHLRSQAALQRTVSPDVPLPSSSTDREAILVEFDKELCQELSCDICSNLYYQPVTTPCQHTFCAKCLQRSIDHQLKCPLCRDPLPSYSYFQDHPCNQTIYRLLLKAYPEVYNARKEAIEQEERDFQLDTPIFVCVLVFPGQPTNVHIFEPRYRLMLRRCLNSPCPQFGMVMPPKAGSPTPLTDFGTMLEIRGVNILADGRSMVHTWGTFRFRILERGTLDGYTVCKFERIDDYPDTLIDSIDCPPELLAPPLLPYPSPSPPTTTAPSSSKQVRAGTSSSPPQTLPSAIPPSPSGAQPPDPSPPPPLRTSPRPSNDEIIEICRTFLSRLQRGTAPWAVRRISDNVGVMPESNPGLFSFWVASALPIDDLEKARLLPIRSARLRLLLVLHWIQQMNSQWYVKLILFSGFFRWGLWKVTELVECWITWILRWVVPSGVGIEPGRQALRAVFTSASFPLFMLAVALWWAI